MVSRMYDDDDGNRYYIAASHDGTKFKTMCHNARTCQTYWLLSVWRDSYERAQEDLDRIARANGWREVIA